MTLKNTSGKPVKVSTSDYRSLQADYKNGISVAYVNTKKGMEEIKLADNFKG